MKKSMSLTRALSMLLVLVMVLSMLPAPHVHAADGAVKLTNSKGEETNTFTVGEPVFVETVGLTTANWLDLWYVTPEGSYESTYRLWFYASEEKVNLWDGTWSEDAGFWNGMTVPAGTYELYLESGSVLATFTLVEPADTSVKSLEIVDDTLASGEKLQIKATNYSEYSWVGIYSGRYEEGATVPASTHYYYCLGHNGFTMEYELLPGEYTVIMYNDYDGTSVQERKFVTVEGEKPVLLTTDKTEYAFGEPIMVTSQLGNPAWVGLYKQSDANPTTAGPVSLFWVYPTVGEAVNILSGDQQRPDEFTAGTYKVLLIDAAYNVLASVENIVITTEIDASKTVTVDASCEKDGSITYYNTDGTVAKVETIPALKHDFDSVRPQYNAENGQHTYVCAHDASHTKTENCTWDEGIVTKQPTMEEAGIMTYTCRVCGGVRTEEISAKTVEREEITKQPTCEEPGEKTVYYTDGTSEVKPLPKLNHAYAEKFTYNEGKKNHSKVCANDPSHVITENCSFESSTINGGKRYTCSVCGGHYDEIVLSTNKDKYAFGEDILVNVGITGGEGYWIGIYRYLEKVGPGNCVSIYWMDTVAAGEYNLLTGAPATDRPMSDWAPGYTYTIYLFSTYDYDIVASVDIFVGPAEIDESKTVITKPTCEANGYITYTYTDGSTKVVKWEDLTDEAQKEELKALGHAYPDQFAYDNNEKSHSKVCVNDASHVITESCSWNDGVVTKEPTTAETGIKTYTCNVCGGTKEEVLPKTDVTVVSTKVIAPTCTQDGYTLVTYSDGSTQKTDIKGALGHDFENVRWTHVDGTHTHTRTCARNCGEEGATVIADCMLETDGVLADWALFYSCTVCSTEWYEPLILTDKKVYNSGEDIIIRVNPNYNWSSTDWIGLYKKGETPNQAGPTSIRWNYVVDFADADGMSIFESSNHDRPEEDVDNYLAAGEYWLYMCKADGYDVAGRVIITVVAKEVKREATQPTCTKDGFVTIFYSDNTTKVEYPEELKALGHDYPETWTPVEGERQHSHTCCRNCGENNATVTENCTFGDGVVTKEPANGELGIKTYTCTVCGNTYTEEFSNATVVTDEVVKKATCEADGLRVITYSDGTTAEIVLPKLGHAYGQWAFDGVNAKTHTKVCANDATHKITERCTFEASVDGNSVTYTCTGCGGSYIGSVLQVEYTTYELTNDLQIMVTFHGEMGPTDWIGLYKKGEAPGTGNLVSMYWVYCNKLKSGEPFNLIADELLHTDRMERVGNGEYTIYLFEQDGYTVIASVDITIKSDIVPDDFTVGMNGSVLENEKVVELPNGTTSVKVDVNSASGKNGAYWIGLYEGKYAVDTSYGSGYMHYSYVEDLPEGGVEMTGLEAGKTYTLVLFSDGGYGSPVRAFWLHIPYGHKVLQENILKAPTCTMVGRKETYYDVNGDGQFNVDDGDFKETTIMDKLGHSYGEWKQVSGTNTHSKVCANDATHVETEDCSFVNGVCSVCNGKPAHVHATTKVPAKAATCTAAGNSEYYTCSCGKWFSDAAATKEITDKASVVIGQKNHSYKSVVTKPTCTKGGYTTYTCQNSGCNHQYVADEVKALGHSYDNGVVTKKPVGNKAGLKKFTCTRCGESYTEEIFAQAVPGSYDRVQGSTRYETSISTANQLKANLGIEKFDTIVVTSGVDFADALSGSYLANQKNAPILLIRNRAEEMNMVVAYIKANLATGGTVYLLGGEKTVPKTMETMLSGYTVKRLSGATRYETNLAILKEAGVAGQDILVCSGNAFADGMSASAVNKPILMVKDSLNDAQRALLKTITGKIYILGGEKVVNARLERELKTYGTTTRISGATRYETSANIAKTFFANTKYLVLVNGLNFPDGLSAGPVANSMGAPVILAAPGKTAAAEAYAKAAGIVSGSVIGGKTVMTDKMASVVFR